MTQPKTLADIFGALDDPRLLDMLDALPGLSDGALLAVIDAARAILSEREQDTLGQSGQEAAPKSSVPRGGGWLELKMIGKYGPYVYRRWREGGRLRSQYVGKVKNGQDLGSIPREDTP